MDEFELWTRAASFKSRQIESVDQRREVIRRLGVKRIIAQLEPAVLDTERRDVGGEYRALAVEMNHCESWRFLQMINQSNSAARVEAGAA
jgi:hypothetical protein